MVAWEIGDALCGGCTACAHDHYTPAGALCLYCVSADIVSDAYEQVHVCILCFRSTPVADAYTLAEIDSRKSYRCLRFSLDSFSVLSGNIDIRKPLYHRGGRNWGRKRRRRKLFLDRKSETRKKNTQKEERKLKSRTKKKYQTEEEYRAPADNVLKFRRTTCSYSGGFRCAAAHPTRLFS